MTQAELITLTLFILAIVGAVTGAWWRVEGKVKEAKESVYHKSDEARSLANAAEAKAALAREELAQYKTHVAETYVSKQGLREMRDEVNTGLKEIKASVSGIHDRIDRMFERSPKRSDE